MLPFRTLWFVLLIFGNTTTTQSIDYGERLSVPKLEERARHLYTIIRCPTCNGQSLDSSVSSTAYDLRQIIRDQLEQGSSDAEIIADFKKRYGESISFEPSLNTQTAVLWGLPLFMVLLGGFILSYRLKITKLRL